MTTFISKVFFFEGFVLRKKNERHESFQPRTRVPSAIRRHSVANVRGAQISWAPGRCRD